MNEKHNSSYVKKNMYKENSDREECFIPENIYKILILSGHLTVLKKHSDFCGTDYERRLKSVLVTCEE